MSGNILNFTIYEILISTIFGLFSIYLSNLFLRKVILKASFVEIIQQKNTAAAIFSGTIIFCVLLLTRTSILPSVNFLQAQALTPAGLSLAFYLKAVLYFLAFFFVAFIAAMTLLFFSSRVFMIATKEIDELKEIQAGNISVSLLISLSMVAFSLYVKPSLEHFLTGVIHFVTQ
jgi:uncharacterized membrane protein YjfL (UPF0719 family)